MKARIAITVLLLLVLSMISGCGQRTENGIIIRTADPNVAFFVPVASAPVAPVDEPEVIPEEEVGDVEPEPEPAPPCQLIKGNISGSGEKIYHVEGGAYYNQVKIDEASGEAWFCSEKNAVDAGFRKASR